MVVGRTQDRHILQEEGVEPLGDGQIVLRPQRPGAQVVEGRPRHRPHGPLHHHVAPQHGQVRRFFRLAPLQFPPQVLERRAVVGRVPDLGRGHPVQPPVARPGRLHHHAALADDVDEGGEQLAIDAVLVEVFRRAVRSDGQHHPVLEQGLEQPPQDHGVGDIRHLQLVETQQPGFGGDQFGDRRDGVVALMRAEHGLAGLRIPLAPLFDQVVDAGHEGVEVRPRLSRLGRRRIEQVHQHRLAPSRRPVEINAPHLRRLAEQAAFGQIDLQPLQRGDDVLLRRIGRQNALFHADVVGVADTGGHGRTA